MHPVVILEDKIVAKKETIYPAMYSPSINITGMLKSTDYDINHIEPGNQVTIYCIWN